MTAHENPPAEASPAMPPAARAGWGWRTTLVVACVLVGWFDGWTLESTGHLWKFGREQKDYYNLLIDGWLDGQLHMKVNVPEALLTLRDPYDPSQRPPDLGLHDASLYRGKCYLYFGAAPVVLLMLPFRVVTGIDLPLGFAVLAFVYAGFLASVGLWCDVRRRYFPDTGSGPAAMCVLVLGLASLAPVLLRRPQMWELPIAAGYAFAMLALWSMWRGLHAKRRRAAWLAAAALALGLAIASRPPYLFAAPLLALPIFAAWRAQRRLPWRAVIGAATPLVVIGGLMAWHNYLRFGHPLEFGQKYQLTSYDERFVPHFSLRYVGFNGWRYFFSRAQWSPYFPFIAPAELPPKPPGFSGHDDLYGVLANLPIGWLALLAPLALRRRAAIERMRLGPGLAAIAGLFVVMAGVLLCFFGSLARYEVDFTPALMLLACVGVLSVERSGAAAGRVLCGVYRAGWACLAVLSAAFAVLFTLEYDGQLMWHNPAKADEVARTLNWIPYAFERVTGVRHGGVALDVRLRRREPGEEVLLTMGEPPHVDRVWVRHTSDESVQIGVAAGGWPEWWSRPLAVDFARAHTLNVLLGSLLPPATHPMFRERSAADVANLTHQVRLEFDGETIVDERRELARVARVLRAGRDATTEGAKQFSGEVTGFRRIGNIERRAPVGFMRMRLTLPRETANRREPLFSERSGGGLIFVQYVDDAGRIAFGSSAGGERSPPGDAMMIEMPRAHEFVARWFPTDDPARRRMELRVDGSIAWTRDVIWGAGDAPIVGRNLGGEPGCAALFSGQIHSVQRSPDDRDPLAGAGDTVRLRVRLPAGRTGEREPLLVTGRPEAGDLLSIEFVDTRSVRFALDHWGGPMPSSDSIAIDYATPHEITITTSALQGPTAETPLRTTRKGALRIDIDGAVVWRTPAPTFAARPDEIAIGANPIGGTSCSERFSGDILSAERAAR